MCEKPNSFKCGEEQNSIPTKAIPKVLIQREIGIVLPIL